MKLLQGRIAGSYLIKALRLVNQATQRRLEMLGFIEGTKLKILNKKQSGTMIIQVRGTRYAVSGVIAGGIEVEVANNE